MNLADFSVFSPRHVDRRKYVLSVHVVRPWQVYHTECPLLFTTRDTERQAVRLRHDLRLVTWLLAAVKSIV